MSVFRSLLPAFACLALATSTQPDCDLGDCEESNLLQRDSLTRHIDQHSLGRGTVDQPIHRADATVHDGEDADQDKILEKLEKLQSDADAAKKKPGVTASQVTGFASQVADTMKCIKAGSSSCSKPKLAESFLKTVSAGLAMASVLPEVGLVAGLGAIVLDVLFPVGSKAKAGPPVLTLKAIAGVVQTQLVDFEQVQVTNFILPSILHTIQSLITEMGLAIKSNSSNTFHEFHQNLRGYYLPQVTSLIREVDSKWGSVVNSGGWVQSEMANLNVFSSQCTQSCPIDPNAHWGSKDCDSALITGAKNLATFKLVASKLGSIGNAMALLPVMAHGVYAKFGNKTDLDLNIFTSAVLPLVQTTLKVNEGLLKVGDCAGAFSQYANSSGTNMISLRNTDRYHQLCSDEAWYGVGWYNVFQLSFGNSFSANNNVIMNNQWYPGDSDEDSQSQLKDWWVSTCAGQLGLLNGLGSESDQLGMCSRVWVQAGWNHNWLQGTSIHGLNYWVCARPAACDAGQCASLFKNSEANFGWQQ